MSVKIVSQYKTTLLSTFCSVSQNICQKYYQLAITFYLAREQFLRAEPRLVNIPDSLGLGARNDGCVVVQCTHPVPAHKLFYFLDCTHNGFKVSVKQHHQILESSLLSPKQSLFVLLRLKMFLKSFKPFLLELKRGKQEESLPKRFQKQVIVRLLASRISNIQTFQTRCFDLFYGDFFAMF